ncbi:thiamine biosynthesis protein ThiS [Clostridiales bacterium 1_7_47FAA]|nr:thiamine biosynthesis protein ThiS [Clostridiales bacterium 1_7_47FAA]
MLISHNNPAGKGGGTMAVINGITVVLTQPVSIRTYLLEHNYRLDRIAVELNGSILPKNSYDTTALTDSDVMEIVNFVGGG